MFRTKNICKSFFIFLLLLNLKSSECINAQTNEDLLKLPIEEILNINVHSTTKTSMKLREAPGTIYSFTSEDFKTYGIQSIDNLYWIIPGIQPYDYKKT